MHDLVSDVESFSITTDTCILANGLDVIAVGLLLQNKVMRLMRGMARLQFILLTRTGI